jgi:diacylglycerol kinase (ATP)
MSAMSKESARSAADDRAVPAHEGLVHKRRQGLARLTHAASFSLAGLRAGLKEPAFRLEVIVGVPMIAESFWLGQHWIEVLLLAGSVVLVMIVELLNTAIESALDRVGLQWHDLTKRAKDLGSAAVFLALLLCLATWAMALWSRFG